MTNYEAVDFLKHSYASMGIQTPSLHMVLGSGFGKALDEISLPGNWKKKGEISFSKVPGLVTATAPDHRGTYVYYEDSNTRKTITFQIGRLHGYEGIDPAQVVQTVTCPLLAGTSHFILTNAAGALCTDFKVGGVMLIEDQVNFTGKNPLLGPNPVDQKGAPIGARFPDMSQLYDRKMREGLSSFLAAEGLSIHKGIYLGLLGPSFETPAEVKLFARWGAHAVGMSTVWEAIALKHAGATLAGVSLLSNMGVGLTDEVVSEEEVIRNSRISARAIVLGLLKFAEKELKSYG